MDFRWCSNIIIRYICLNLSIIHSVDNSSLIQWIFLRKIDNEGLPCCHISSALKGMFLINLKDITSVHILKCLKCNSSCLVRHNLKTLRSHMVRAAKRHHLLSFNAVIISCCESTSVIYIRQGIHIPLIYLKTVTTFFKIHINIFAVNVCYHSRICDILHTAFDFQGIYATINNIRKYL